MKSQIENITIGKTIVLYKGYKYKVINLTDNKNLVIHALAPYVHPSMEIVNINQVKIIDDITRNTCSAQPKGDN